MVTQWQMTYLSGASYFSPAWEIENPTNDIVLSKISNMTKTDLIDGTIARRTPTTKYKYNEIDLEFNFVSGSSVLLKDVAGVSKSIDTLFNANEKVKIIDHENYEWIGYFTDVAQTYKVGQYVDSTGSFKTFYDVTAKFDVVSRTAGT